MIFKLTPICTSNTYFEKHSCSGKQVCGCQQVAYHSMFVPFTFIYSTCSAKSRFVLQQTMTMTIETYNVTMYHFIESQVQS